MFRVRQQLILEPSHITVCRYTNQNSDRRPEGSDSRQNVPLLAAPESGCSCNWHDSNRNDSSDSVDSHTESSFLVERV